MHVAKLLVAGSIVAVVAACSGAATPTPGAGGGAGGGGAAASAAGAGAGAGASQAAGGGAGASADTGGATASGGAGASGAAGGGGTGMVSASTAKMCALLTSDEARSILGKPLQQDPSGMSLQGLGTNCIWQTDAAMTDGTYIKVEINTVPYQDNMALVLYGSTPQQFTMAGLAAAGIDKGTGGSLQGVLLVQLSRGPKDPSMVIQAPSLDAAKSVATKVLGRLDSLK